MKPPSRQRVPVPNDAELEVLSRRARYTGSVEHKDKRSWLGPPQPRRHGRRTDSEDHRQNATICPLVGDADRERATEWVRTAIRDRQYNPALWEGDFPRFIWYKDDADRYWIGRCFQRGAGQYPQGEYKGWPVSKDEWREIFG